MQALQAATPYVDIAEGEAWKYRWRLAELSDARDMWYCLLGRSGALSAHLQCGGLPAPETGLVLVGAHWGTGLRALVAFRQARLQPRFVYRKVERAILRAAPFQYLYLKGLVVCIDRLSAGRAIEVPGARRAFQAALTEPGSPVILLDAPALNPGVSMCASVLDRQAEFNRNGAAVLAEGGARCVFYSSGVSASGEAELECTTAASCNNAERLMQDYGAFLTRLLHRDSAQWRLWHAAPQFFRDPA